MNDSSSQHPDDEAPIVGKLVGDTTRPQAGVVEPRSDAPEPSPQNDLSEPDGSGSAVNTGSPFAENSSVRTGSPFATDPDDLWDAFLPVAGEQQAESLYDVGPLKYTAIGAVAAAVMVLGFAAAASWWFPGGGTLIAALGCALSIFGLYSPRKQWAAGCLVLHLMLFLFSYSRAIMV